MRHNSYFLLETSDRLHVLNVHLELQVGAVSNVAMPLWYTVDG